MPVQAPARSARLLFGGARFPRVARVSPRSGEGHCHQRSAAAAPLGPPPADLRKTRPETSFAFEGPCALGEASVRRRALPTRSLRDPGTEGRALLPKEGSGGASRAGTGPKGEISP
eukprot:scaffold145_cov51-Phaeocystis_antarctica.AAC.1